MPEAWVERGVTLPAGIHLSPAQDWTFEVDGAAQLLSDHFRVATLSGFGFDGRDDAVAAAGAVLQYLRSTQKQALEQLTTIRAYSTESFMVLDQFTRRNLELLETIRGDSKRGCLLSLIDRTVTAMGGRLLRRWLTQPLLGLPRLNARLDAVEALFNNDIARDEIAAALKPVADIERLTNRVALGRVGPRELLGIKEGLGAVPRLRELIADMPSLNALTERLDPCQPVHELIDRAINAEPPATLNASGIIRPGYDSQLDAVVNASQGAREWIAGLESQERQRLGIPSLKVSYNKVFGYYIEVTNAHTDKVPEDYLRKQTLVNAERYITPELKEYESRVLSAEEEILAIERRLFSALCQQVAASKADILKTASAIAHLDALLSLAEVAAREGYTRPPAQRRQQPRDRRRTPPRCREIAGERRALCAQ